MVFVKQIEAFMVLGTLSVMSPRAARLFSLAHFQPLSCVAWTLQKVLFNLFNILSSGSLPPLVICAQEPNYFSQFSPFLFICFLSYIPTYPYWIENSRINAISDSKKLRPMMCQSQIQCQTMIFLIKLYPLQTVVPYSCQVKSFFFYIKYCSILLGSTFK